MNKIKILKTTKCDTRAIDDNFTETDVLSDSIKHISAVMSVAEALAYTFVGRCTHHDWTKIDKEHLHDYFEALKSKKVGDEFKKLKWYQDHITLERHHPADHCCDDINLLDILEMCIDVVVAGKARTGEIYKPEIDDSVLRKALNNTIDWIAEAVEVVDGEEAETEVMNNAFGIPNDKIDEDVVDIMR